MKATMKQKNPTTESYPREEMQSVYSTAPPTDWARYFLCVFAVFIKKVFAGLLSSLPQMSESGLKSS